MNPPQKLRPLLRAMQNRDDLNRFLSHAVNNDEREPHNRQFPRASLTTKTATVWQIS